jgi:hypothetical protein
MTALKVLPLAFLLFSSVLFSQINTFRLGFSGTYPEVNTYPSSQYTDWSFYPELSMNFWQGFGIGDQQKVVVDKLNKHS